MPPKNTQINSNILEPKTNGVNRKNKLFLKKVAQFIGLVLLIFGFIYTIWLLLPRSINFTYSANSCITQPILMPSTIHTNDQSYQILTDGGLKIARLHILSSKICIKPLKAPKENHKNQLTLKLYKIIPVKSLSISTPHYPKINLDTLSQPVAPTKSAELKLSNTDNIFTYNLKVGKKSTVCNVSQQSLTCPLANLAILPGTSNPATLNRTFNNNHIETIFDDKIQTLDPINVIGGNAVNGNIIYDQPNDFEIIFDKPLSDVTKPIIQTKDGDTFKEIESSYEIKESRLIIKPTQPFVRKSTYILTLDQATSTTGNVLLSAYNAEFSLSGGPKVIKHNTGTYAFDPNKTISLNFDQNINPNQELSSVIKMQGTGLSTHNITISGKSIHINPNQSLPNCTNVTIELNNNLQNEHGVTGDSTWKHSFRTLCRRSSSIGTSTQGRSIVAHWFGSGSNIVMFIGGIHGNEKSSILTLESWLDDLEKHADKIPAGRTIVVITTANPDGYSSNSRFNARGVDLNRNFPTANWSSTVSGPGYTDRVNGGGESSLSEPEAISIANFVRQYRPRAVLTFHSQASLVTPNYAGDSDSIARLYDSKVSYNYANTSQTDAALGYSTTGDFEFWLRDIGIPNVLIEHSTLAKNEFTKNRDALWAMVGL